MILEVLFQSFRYGDIASQIIGTLVGALTALAAGIILVAMTKAYGFGVLWSSGRSGDGPNTGPSTVAPIRASLLYFAALIVGVGVAAPAIFFLASNAAAPLLHSNAFESLVTGRLGVPAYFVILSGAPFGGFSPTFTAVFMLGLLSVPFLISRLGTPWRMRKAQGWFAGDAPPTDPSQMYNSYGYSTPIRIMLRFLFRTKETVVRVGSVRRTVVLSPEEYVVELEVLDVFKSAYDLLARWSLWLSATVSRRAMPGKLGQYIVYIMIAFIFVLLYILVTVG